MAYRRCPYCEAYLDPGEICDCRNEPKISDDKKAAMPASTAADPHRNGDIL